MMDFVVKHRWKGVFRRAAGALTMNTDETFAILELLGLIIAIQLAENDVSASSLVIMSLGICVYSATTIPMSTC